MSALFTYHNTSADFDSLQFQTQFLCSTPSRHSFNPPTLPHYTAHASFCSLCHLSFRWLLAQHSNSPTTAHAHESRRKVSQVLYRAVDLLFSLSVQVYRSTNAPLWTTAADVWGMGVVLYAMLANAPLRWEKGAIDFTTRALRRVSADVKVLIQAKGSR